MTIHGLVGPSKVLSMIQKAQGRPILFVTYNEIESVSLFQDMSSFADTLRFSPAGVQILETTVVGDKQDRVNALIGALQGKSVVASVDALMPKLAPRSCFEQLAVRLEQGTVMELDDLTRRLIALGFERVDMVGGFGQFAVRGDIFDIGYTTNVRVEFFDIEVYAVKQLDIATQRSGESLAGVTLYPVTTAPITDYTRLYQALEQESRRIGNSIDTLSARMQARVQRYMEYARQGLPFSDVESMASLIYEHPGNILSYMDDPLVVIDEPEKCRERIQSYHQGFLQKFQTHFEKGQALSFQENMYDTQILDKLPPECTRLQEFYTPKEQNIVPVRRLYEKLTQAPEFFSMIKNGKDCKTYIFCGNEKRARRMIQMLGEQDIGASYLAQFADIQVGHIVTLPLPLSASVEYLEEKIRLISDREQGVAKKKKRQLDVFIDLEPGDYVVHVAHGIGKYLGLKTITTLDKSRDYMLLEYEKGDKLYLPTDQMDRIQKYVGAGEAPPRISKLGGKDWDRIKSKVKASVQDMAEDLVKLYAQRTSRPGYAFSQDTPWQKEFEDSFEYEDTEDQASSIAQIKADMEASTIMDRLLCGDVGYGKTEVALRAMFKCVTDGKQAAMLVPTTVLARQHYHTMIERMKSFPVRIASLSRLNTAKETTQTLKQLAAGEIDILVGTHKLLNAKVKYKDLGLLIIDEEQRFGVAHKEKLKALKTNVDVLTLSATPIPRTLYMSLIGIRDMSVINTPPGDRQETATYVLEYSPELAVDAIVDEVNRKGQVYFVYNKVSNIQSFAGELQKRLPQVRIGIGHGQMGQKELEQVMLDFYAGDIDVLLSSTIVESGLDVENANTLIIYDADRFGLSQLYQLRGRVGRSARQAYAYFTYRGNLAEKAFKRLCAIRDFTELGSGFKIAMRDLEIRGAGNILGAEQYGHLTEVGYDMYARLVNEAVSKIKGVAVQPEIETTLKLDLDAYIPKQYIASEPVKMEVYKKIADIEDDSGKQAIVGELTDRFGQPPQTVLRLLEVAILRRLAQRVGLTTISKQMYGYVLTYSGLARPDNQRLLALSGKFSLQFGKGEPFGIVLKTKSQQDDGVLKELIALMQALLC